jgi:hypothetical protein
MNKISNWNPVIYTFEKRLSLWKAGSLSIGGRVTLIKSVLNSLPTYYLSLFKAPISVIDKLDRMRRNFCGGFRWITTKCHGSNGKR